MVSEDETSRWFGRDPHRMRSSQRLRNTGGIADIGVLELKHRNDRSPICYMVRCWWLPPISANNLTRRSDEKSPLQERGQQTRENRDKLGISGEFMSHGSLGRLNSLEALEG